MTIILGTQCTTQTWLASAPFVRFVAEEGKLSGFVRERGEPAETGTPQRLDYNSKFGPVTTSRV